MTIVNTGDQHQSAALPTVRCSFCGKPRDEVRSIVCGATSDLAICNECVELCSEIMAEELNPPADGHPNASS